MKRTDRFLVAGLAIGSVCLLMLLVGGAILLWWVLPPSPKVTADQRRLIDQLRNGEYTRLEDIQPKPHSIHAPEELGPPTDEYRWCLYYHLEDGGGLSIYVDKNLRLVRYTVRNDFPFS